MQTIDIAAVVRRAGVPTSTLRYYEQLGLIASCGRRGLRRQYRPEVFERLALIALGSVAGFSLAEIATMVGADGRPRVDRRRLAAKAEELDAMIRRLRAVRDGLRHAAACPATRHADCPSFRRLVRAAAAGILPKPGGRGAGRKS